MCFGANKKIYTPLTLPPSKDPKNLPAVVCCIVYNVSEPMLFKDLDPFYPVLHIAIHDYSNLCILNPLNDTYGCSRHMLLTFQEKCLIFQMIYKQFSALFDFCKMQQNENIVKFRVETLYPTQIKLRFEITSHKIYSLERQSRLLQTTCSTSFPIFEKNKVWYFMRIVDHALFVIFEKAAKFGCVVCCNL